MDKGGALKDFIEQEYDGDEDAFYKAVENYRLPQRPNRAPVSTPPSAGEAIVSIEHLHKTYHMRHEQSVTAINDVSMQVKKGEIVALTGASGSGKSTLMHLIGGLDQPDSGTITVDGKRIDNLSAGQLAAYRNHSIGFVFQFFYLQPFLRVDRNVEVPLMFAKARRSEREKLVHNQLDVVGLQDKLSSFPKELSGGQMQRVAIARALVNNPKILLADEPTGNLDSATSGLILEQLSKIRDQFGTTMIIVTHDQDVANWADRQVHIKDGQLI